MYKTLKYKYITFITGCKLLPPQGYSAITLFGYVFTRKSYSEVSNILSTPKGKVWANHESIHIAQKTKVWSKTWIVFYILYLFYFFKAWPFSMSWKIAYKTIPFEIEAYQNQGLLDYPDNYNESMWKRYIYSNKVRKKLYSTLYKKS